MAKTGPKPFTFPGDKATNEWLSSQTRSARNGYRIHWRRFLAYTSMTGGQILASRKDDRENLWEKKTLAYKEWLKTQKNKKGEPLSDYFVRQSTVAIRSFFSFHRVELKFRAWRADEAR